MTFLKRLLDIIYSVTLLVALFPIFIIISVLIFIFDGRPILYISERMKTPTQGFLLLKFRTMKNSNNNTGVSGGDKSNRISNLGRFLRAKRLDELPQLLNVLKGDISFVGPRPPLRQYVEAHPDIYYLVLRSCPGITGLASVVYHEREEAVLSSCQSPEETDAVYQNVCIPKKARLDNIYYSNRNVCFDFRIMLMTLFKSLR